ncbi:GNAT family N-acetyltransferase [Alterisphingorhabdus coralli]|uniref:GNAT family N-acetyltransferase n=1 Tax=Alterisphingorhabdus coralli TaxID=3071408 RepID=A0AA97I207_9SPHN|nr:GNAT family N-acetyltransferase [Parasphingorhabdus sp. SCSIO 66989]WOE75290.1 GNAT family N-acetyltransferase [Parasphingorhabdus sp. SCSIO 66989]
MVSAPRPLSAEDDLSAFDCGDLALNQWLRQKALKNESRFSRTYIVCSERRVVGYYAVAAGSVQREAAPSRLKRNAPDPIPVAILGRLAVDQSFQGQGLGKDMLADGLRRMALASRSIGIAAILVQAKDDAARDFYLSCAEFLSMPGQERTLFLPMETIVASL